jgi:hypothetical protein
VFRASLFFGSRKFAEDLQRRETRGLFYYFGEAAALDPDPFPGSSI